MNNKIFAFIFRFGFIILFSLCFFLTFACSNGGGGGPGRGPGSETEQKEPPPYSGVARYPFPQWDKSLATYTVKPKLPSLSRKQMEDKMINLLKEILNKNLIFDSGNSGSYLTPDKFRIVFEHHADMAGSGNNEQHITVSESHGYGMMILALMAGCEGALTAAGHTWRYGATDLQQYYDGMLRTVLAFKSKTSRPAGFQMAWELMGYNTGTNDTGFSLNDNNTVRTRGFRYSENSNTSAKIAPFAYPPSGNTSATDGDMDIMYSLILADKQWGSGGKFNYRQYALEMMTAFYAATGNATLVNPTYKFLKLGDWANNTVTSGMGRGTRPSDFILSHLKAYKAFDSSNDWQSVIDATYDIIRVIREGRLPDNGLLPDFVVRNGTTAVGGAGQYWEPAPSGFLEGSNDGNYSYNSCRTPWRLGTDYLLYGDVKIGNSGKGLKEYVLNPINTKAEEAVGPSFPSSLSGLGQGKQLNASSFSGSTSSTFATPFLVSAAAVSTNQAWIDALWNYTNLASHENNWYADYYKLLCMITASGNYWRPDSIN